MYLCDTNLKVVAAVLHTSVSCEVVPASMAGTVIVRRYTTPNTLLVATLVV